MNKPTREEQELMDRLELINIQSYSDYPLSVRSFGNDGETLAIETDSKIYGQAVKQICKEFNEVFFTNGELVIYD